MKFVCAMSTGQSKKSRESHNAKFRLPTANFRTVGLFPLRVLACSCLCQQMFNFDSHLVTRFKKTA